MDKHLLDILCCPLTKAPVRMLRREQIDALNRSIANGGVVTTNGAQLGQRLDAALITSDGRTIYRIEDDIPVMLVDEGIETRQLVDFPN